VSVRSRRAAVEAAAAVLRVEAELRRDHHLLADRFEGLADDRRNLRAKTA
jgi:hypothetical protein